MKSYQQDVFLKLLIKTERHSVHKKIFADIFLQPPEKIPAETLQALQSNNKKFSILRICFSLLFVSLGCFSPPVFDSVPCCPPPLIGTETLKNPVGFNPSEFPAFHILTQMWESHALLHLLLALATPTLGMQHPGRIRTKVESFPSPPYSFWGTAFSTVS